tara:strand:+ start:260 stop:1924 length:1665 start_codon:yes stop_codon:yes gene_type:complete
VAHNKNKAKYFQSRFRTLEKERQSFIPHYKDLSEFIQPRRGRFFVTNRNVGGPRHSKIINSKATQAHRSARAGLFAGVMSPARPWFALRVRDNPDLMEFGPVKIWLADVEERMRAIFNKSNLYSMAPVMLGELLLFSTGCMTHADDFKDVARFYTHTVGSYMIAQDARGVVTTLVRKYEMTTLQLVEAFGLSSVSQNVKDQYDQGNYDAWHSVVHFIEPNPDVDPSKAGSQFKAFRSVKYQPSELQVNVNGKFLSRRGFDRFPGYIPRWEITGEDIYGTDCPGMTSLGDVKGLQVKEKRLAQGIDKVVNPPLKGPASIRNVPVESLPGGLTIYDAGAGTEKLEPLYLVQPNVQELVADINRTERRIDEAFYVDLFFAISNMEGIQPKNQMELLHRNEERLLQLGPVLERVHGEFLDGMVDRTFDQMIAAELIPPAPKELQGAQLKIEYISSLAMAQRAVATGSIDRLFGFAGGLRGMGYDQINDKLDADQALDNYSSLIGVPPRLVVPDDAVAEVRQEREQERQEQLQQVAQVQAAAGMKDEAAAVKDIGEANV